MWMEIFRGIKELFSKIKWKSVLHFLFGIGWTLVLWEIWENNIKMNSNPLLVQHGYYGLVIIMLIYLYQNKSLFVKKRE